MNLIDRWYEITDPKKALSRQRDRVQLDMLRAYTAANPDRLNGSYSRRKTRGSDEVARGHTPLAGGAQELVRNTAIGNRIKAVIATNMIGTGIKPDYVGGAKRPTQRYKETFDAWANSTACDYEGHNNLWGLQWLWAATVVESGGVFVRQIINNALAFPLVLQTLEQQFLDESRSGQVDGGEIISGIKYSSEGELLGYYLKTKLVSQLTREESQFYSADDVVHIYRKDRAGQHLGVSWLHPVADLIHDRQEWRDASLTLQRMAACMGIIIKEAPGDMGLKTAGTPLRDEAGLPYTELEAGMIAYASSNTDITTVTPPNVSSGTEFNSEVLQDIAVGVGVTREQITGDFSQVTWASGRLARGEFYANLDRWQLFMMLPGLNKVHDWFDGIYAVKVGKVGVTRSWILPHRSAVNPKEELDVDIAKVRTCAMTPQQFSAKHGGKFEDILTGWLEAKALFGEMPFDHDPSQFSSAGNQLDDNDAASANSNGNARIKKKAKADDKGANE
uniref:phage portal protein n=1 Tax=Marinobacterium profundum TaxID=1714300 RepID=UPI0008367ECA|nr:phage portal protein [Marinobacterium profundum]